MSRALRAVTLCYYGPARERRSLLTIRGDGPPQSTTLAIMDTSPLIATRVEEATCQGQSLRAHHLRIARRVDIELRMHR